MARINTNEPAEMVNCRCECGMKWRQEMRHYDTIRCRCNLAVWALRPKRNGPLVCYQHPGYSKGTRVEMVG